MGKIFGISDLPVSTIMTPFEPIVEFKNPYKETKSKTTSKIEQSKDVFLPENTGIRSNPIISMRNGFGKLMKHFQRKNIKGIL